MFTNKLIANLGLFGSKLARFELISLGNIGLKKYLFTYVLWTLILASSSKLFFGSINWQGFDIWIPNCHLNLYSFSSFDSSISSPMYSKEKASSTALVDLLSIEKTRIFLKSCFLFFKCYLIHFSKLFLILFTSSI
jgi:hypothetical protein